MTADLGLDGRVNVVANSGPVPPPQGPSRRVTFLRAVSKGAEPRPDISEAAGILFSLWERDIPTAKCGSGFKSPFLNGLVLLAVAELLVPVFDHADRGERCFGTIDGQDGQEPLAVGGDIVAPRSD